MFSRKSRFYQLIAITLSLAVGSCLFGSASNKANSSPRPKKSHLWSFGLSDFPDSSEISVPESSRPSNSRLSRAKASYGKLPLSFEVNRGQVGAQTGFLARSGSYDVFLSPQEAVFFLRRPGVPKAGDRSLAASATGDRNPTIGSTVRMKLVGGNQVSQMQGVDQLPGRINYFRGDDPDNWRGDIPTYAKVHCDDVYPGVDMIYNGNNHQLEYDFVVAPGADPKVIRLAFTSPNQVLIDRSGNLVLRTSGGEIRQERPIIYQEKEGVRKYVNGRYALKANHEIGFVIGTYDRSKPLVIDPVLVYSTYIGGANFETCFGIAVTEDGTTYLTGTTNSLDFPSVNSLQPFRGTNDAFVLRLNSEGTQLLSATYLGGNGSDQGQAIAVDPAGNIYVAGSTSGNFPILNALRPNHGGRLDCFLTKLNPMGSALIWSTYIGGSGDDASGDKSVDVAIDANGDVYLAGRTNSVDFPIVNSIQPSNHGNFDAFIVKINSSGSAFIFSTYFGGAREDEALAIAVNAAGESYITGVTFSSDLPTGHAIDSTLAGAFDSFVAKFDGTGHLVFSTYLGGNDQEDGFGGDIAVDDQGFAYVTGSSGSTDFPIVNGAQTTNHGSHDLFVTKFTPDGSSIVFSTLLGGAGTDAGLSIAVDTSHNVYVSGFSSATDFPTVNPISATRKGSSDAIIVKLDSSGAIVYASYYGGSAQETGYAIAVDNAGSAYMAGVTTSADLPITNQLQSTLHGNFDGFVAKIFDAPALAIKTVVANKGGNHGTASVSILGAGFQTGAVVKLRHANQPDIEGANSSVVTSSQIKTTFDLHDAIPGPRDVVVTLPGGSSITLQDGFTIELGGSAQPWVDIVGRDTIRLGSPGTYNVIYGNRGNVDAVGVPLWIGGIPTDATVNLDFAITAPPQLEGQSAVDWSQVPIEIKRDNERVLPLFLPLIPPGYTGVLQFSLTVPTREQFQLHAWVNSPYFQSPLNPKAIDCGLAVGGVALSALGFIPGETCVASIALAFAESVLTAVQLGRDLPSAGTSTAVFSVVQVQANGLDKVLSIGERCGASFTPGLAEISAAVQTGLALADTYDKCKDVVAPAWEAFTAQIRVVLANDPNDKVGSRGSTSAQFLSGGDPLPYVIYFQNKASASAPAQVVKVSDQLDLSKLDPGSLVLGPTTFGNHQLVPLATSNGFTGSVDLRPDADLIVKLHAELNSQTGVLTWQFSSLDTTTGLPPDDPLAGFLAPGEEGSVLFTIHPKADLATGTLIQNQASIIFDNNAAIATQTWSNTLDNSNPSSRVLPLPATQNTTSFNVNWSGTDSGSGIGSFSVFASQDGQPYTVWLRDVAFTQSTFTGQAGSTYSFYVIARDLTGRLENSKTIAEATTQVVTGADLSITNAASANTVMTGSNVTYTITVINNGPGAASPVQLTDQLPQASMLVSCLASDGQVCGGSGNSRSVNFPTLAPNSSATLTIVARLDCLVPDGTLLSNIASVSSSNSDPNPSNNSAEAKVSASNAPPLISCPANIVRANDAGLASAVVNYPLPVGTDNCSTPVISCSRPTGSAFSVGTTMVTCTATDSAGTQSTCPFTVTVNDNEAPKITHCAVNKSLSTNGGSQIAMPDLTGEIIATDNFSPPASLTVIQSPPAGSMIGIGNTPVTITVKDAANNAAVCIASVNVSRFSLGDFVVISREFSQVLAHVKVISGNLGTATSLPAPNGVRDDVEEVVIGEYVQMLGVGSYIVGDSVRLRANSQVQNIIYNELYNLRGDILGGRFSPLSLPVITLPVLPPITPGTQDIEVPANQIKSLAPGRYRTITVRNRGTLILTGGVYELSSLDIRQDTRILFNGPAEVRVKNEMDTDARAYIGPDSSATSLKASQIVFYVAGPDDRGRHHDEDEDLTPTAVQIGQRNTAFVNIVAPNGTVWLKSNTKATGSFVGKRVRIGEGAELTLSSAF